MSLISAIFGSDKRVLKLIQEIKDAMANQQQEIDQLTGKVKKIEAEVHAGAEALREQIRLLQEQIDAGATELDLTRLTAAVDQLDQIHPDTEV